MYDDKHCQDNIEQSCVKNICHYVRVYLFGILPREDFKEKPCNVDEKEDYCNELADTHMKFEN